MKSYFVVGGMPVVVQQWLDTHDYWQSIPSQLAKENKKFVYGLVREGARAREYEDLQSFKVYMLDMVRSITRSAFFARVYYLTNRMESC